MIEILDASALLAFFKKEPGCEKIKEIFLEGQKHGFAVFIHQINYIEVAKKLVRNFGFNNTKNMLASLTQPFFGVSNYMNDELATYATQIFLESGVSLADSIGLAYTKAMEGRFWTADRALEAIARKEKVTLLLIR